MDKSDVKDVRKLEYLYLETSAEVRSLRIVISTLRLENEHLRHIIELLVPSNKTP